MRATFAPGLAAGPGRLGRRLWALLALASLALAATTAALGVAEHLPNILGTIAALLVIVGAGWYAVTRTGLGRTSAVIVVLAGGLIVLAGILGTALSGTRVLTVALLGAIAVASARIALGQSAKAARERTQARTGAPPARQPVLLVNPRSGDGKAERFGLVDECQARGIESIVLERGDDPLALAEDAIARGADVIGAAAGDGTQAAVATVAMRHDVPFVVVPAGTRNHFALDLGLDRDDVIGALDAYSDGVEQHVDAAALNGRVFVNNATVGLYAQVVSSPEYRDAKGSTFTSMLPELLGPDAEPLDLRFHGPDGSEYSTADMILVSNDPYQLDMRRGGGTRKRLDRGVLGIATLCISSGSELARFVALQATRRPDRFPGWLEWTAPEFRIDSGGPVEIGIDGESVRLDPPLVFETRPQALRVRLPRHAVGSSPSARAVHLLARSTVVQLTRTAFGP